MWRIIAGEILDISSLSDTQFVTLVAHYNDLFLGDTNKISSEVKSRGYSEAALAEIKNHKRLKFEAIESCGLRFTQPFDHLKFKSLNYVLTLYDNYVRGCLPYPGSVSEQPAQIMEIFSVVEAIRREQELKAVKASERLSGRNQHKDKSRTRR